MTKNKMTLDILNTAGVCMDTLSKKRNGNYIARRGFFYTNGCSGDSLAGKIKTKFPEVTIIDSGDHWKPFRGGDTIKQGSHFYVKFTMPTN